ncbi:hypothetical protein [Sediminibacillus halophilus]|uniref:S1 motif domain-containing protein n=1 Tax=Sediminibacillus halophilus TaxID=482461 RepID=A0A1G9UDA2_9BACI|nr:hypothetical protein [Sediminibacillus halophilus]SDM57906.1 hypothetical protein SAMN05216244_2971 [Sediminibacillus halophilus]
MTKSKIFFIVATLASILIACSQSDEGTFMQGDITEIDKESGDMEVEVEAWTTIGEPESSTVSSEFIDAPTSQTIRVSNPEDYEEGEKVKVKVIKNYEEDVWDLDRLTFEVEELN